MKTKQLFKSHLFSLAALFSMALAAISCANEDIAQNGKDGDNGKGFATFVADAPTQTRTSIDYATGNFYWEEGDKIYVKDDDGTMQVSNAVDAAHAHSASFKFKVPGKFGGSATYKVYYLGKNGGGNQVTIPTAQTQTTPNATDHLGDSGDYGTATATGTLGGSIFSFQLEHQPTYLVFQPYTSNAILKNCYLTKIEVNSDDDISETYTIDPTTGNLNSSAGSKQIVLTTKDPVTGSTNEKGFSFTNAASISTADKIYMLIKPGTHTLKVRYWIKDYVTNVEGTITKALPSYNYAKNTYYDMTANLDVRDYEVTRCHWDAQADYWVGHKWNAANPADRWQPVVTTKPFPHYDELKEPVTPPRAPNNSYLGLGVRNDAVNLCKDCPNANELAWYVEKGDPRFDADILWTCMGHLRKGGLWLKKKAKIASDNGKTISDIENKAPDNRDWRITPSVSFVQKVTNLTPPSSVDINDYLFLPAIGNANDQPSQKSFYMTGGNASFWSSSSEAAAISLTKQAFALNFYMSGNNELVLYVSSGMARNHNIMNVWKFE